MQAEDPSRPITRFCSLIEDTERLRFTGLDVAMLDSCKDLLEDPDLADILLYHVTRGRRYSESVVNAPGIEMLNGAQVTVDGTMLNDGQAEI